jgi:hypothetical protein
MDAVGTDWQFNGIAAHNAGAGAAMGNSNDQGGWIESSNSQLVQAMAGFDADSGAADGLNTVALSAETSQQTFLTTPHA